MHDQRASSLIALLFLISAAPGNDPPPPNVVLILVDDMGWSDLGCTGSTYYETPNVDRLAREGMLFGQGYAACAVCSPSRAALLTGRTPARLGITDWIHHSSDESQRALAADEHLDGFDAPKGRKLLTPINRAWLDASERTLPEILSVFGHVACYVGKWHLGPKGHLPTDQGFDENHGGFQVGHPPSYFDPYAGGGFDGIEGLPPRREGEYLTDREADEAVGFIRRNAQKPFFLYLAHYAVHSPMRAPEETVAKYADKSVTNQKVPVYAAMVEHVDRAVGRVLDTLDELDLTDNTLVIFTSDNGGAVHFPATDNAPLRKGKGYPYEGGLRVPFIVRWPGVVEAGTVCNVPVSGIDVLPTIVDAFGVLLPQDRIIDGESLMPLFRGGDKLRRKELTWHFPHYWWGTRIQPYSVIRRGDMKLIWHHEDGRLELFDLGQDPGEEKNLAGERREMAKRLEKRLVKTLREQGAKFPERNPEWEEAD